MKVRWLLFAGGVLISAFTILQGIDAFDEGIALQAARRVSEGQVPYADFTWAYGPATPYLLGGLFKAFGVSLLQWRILRVIADAAVALVVYVLLRRFDVSHRVALLGWLAAACAMAQPRSANPFPYALLFALLAFLPKRALPAAALTAVAAAFRLDFALYGAAAVAVLMVLDRRWRDLAHYAAISLGLVLLVYAPFLVDIGPGKLYDALIGTSLHDRGYWTLSFPFSYDGSLSIWRPHAFKDLLDHYQPLLLVVGFGIAALAAALHRVWAGLVVFGIGALSYLLSRTDEFHTQPLFVVLAIVLPAVVVWQRSKALSLAAAAVFALMLVHGVANRGSALFDPPPLERVHVDAADGAEAPPPEARALERVVADIHARVPPGDPIYVAPRRSDLVAYTNAVLYVLADRDNAARRDFGLTASATEQQRIVDQLRAARPQVVVRWTDPLSSQAEPNLRGRSTGVRTLDDYLSRDYRLLERLYHYDVLVPR
jgi:hypothetical protein